MSKKKNVKVSLPADQVTTLEELAKDLARIYGWKSYAVDRGEIRFEAESGGEAVNGILETSGFAFDAETDEPLDEWNVDWDEDFDAWSNYVWAEDEDGNTVMLHD